MRPLFNGMVGAKKSLSSMSSEVLVNILEIDSRKICKSTEEMIYSMEKCNKEKENENDDKKIIIGSMDVVSLYPRIKAERAAEIVKDAIKKSRVVFEGIDIDALGKYLRTYSTTEELEKAGFADIIPTKPGKKRKKAVVPKEKAR